MRRRETSFAWSRYNRGGDCLEFRVSWKISANLIRCITWFSLCWCFADNYRAISSRACGDRASQFATTICLRYRCKSRWSGGPRQTGDRDCTLMESSIDTSGWMGHDPQENPRPGFGSWISSAYACTGIESSEVIALVRDNGGRGCNCLHLS